MRRPSRRMQRDEVVIYRRSESATNSRGAAAPAFGAGVVVRASFQPLGDTGRRMDRTDAQMRMGGEDSWRVWFAAEDAEAAGLSEPYCKAGDRVEYAGRVYVARSRPVPQRRTQEGVVLSYSVDVDGTV